MLIAGTRNDFSDLCRNIQAILQFPKEEENYETFENRRGPGLEIIRLGRTWVLEMDRAMQGYLCRNHTLHIKEP